MTEREHPARQGEVDFFIVPIIDTSRWQPLGLEDGRLIIGHSETGHHHVIEHPERVDIRVDPAPPEGMTILRMIVAEPTRALHLRGHDTHKAIDLAPGHYEIRTPVEYDHYAEMARRVAD